MGFGGMCSGALWLSTAQELLPWRGAGRGTGHRSTAGSYAREGPTNTDRCRYGRDVRAAVEQVVQAATTVLKGQLTPREGVTILATLTRDALAAARELRATEPEQADVYRELITGHRPRAAADGADERRATVRPRPHRRARSGAARAGVRVPRRAPDRRLGALSPGDILYASQSQRSASGPGNLGVCRARQR